MDAWSDRPPILAQGRTIRQFFLALASWCATRGGIRKMGRVPSGVIPV
jgi:hypothetical protein